MPGMAWEWCLRCYWKFKQALEAFDKAIVLDREHGDAWFANAKIFAGLAKSNQGPMLYKQAVAFNKNDIEAWLNYANLIDQMEKSGNAIEIVKKALEYNPDEVDLLYALAAYSFKNKPVRFKYPLV
jgi:tetratricopeptide (TPR) repeat protein